ncbi:hypothetical protein [Lacticaseibacillus salsurivasis]|uniref:hypothetical protein n=1 Tax=Lacticaseibacillus salsurivasis TaxID=3081441 RepID=UPI0030C6F269
MNGQDRYEERTAVEALKKRIPEKFATAYLPREDMPDVRVTSGEIGVEVVIGEKLIIQRVLRMNNPAIKNPVDALRRMGITSGYHVVVINGVRAILPDAYWGSGNDIKRAVRSKVFKARNYTKFDENDLFIHVTDSRDEIKMTVSVVSEMVEMPFNFIYLWDGQDLVEVNTADGSSKVY